MSSQPVRSLEHLENTASTARVLNLRATALRYQNDAEYKDKPFFDHPALNKAIIVKHRLRPHEHEEFYGYRRSATKVLLPIELADLRIGARYLFIGQRNFDRLLEATYGIELRSGDRDMKVLTILDETPSLDPFLLREQLKRHGIDAAPCYFDISEADMNRMFDFAQHEIQQLVEMSFGGAGELGEKFRGHAAKLARKILQNANDAELEPLRQTMQLSPEQYQEGIFCWKAFLYYKWRLSTVVKQLNGVVAQIAEVSPRGSITTEMRASLTSSKESIRKAIVASYRKVSETLRVYDDSYDAMTKRGDPLKFRDFLLQAPALFNDLGERLGAIDHIISFWRFRFPMGRKPIVTGDELGDIFADFEQSLAFQPREQAA